MQKLCGLHRYRGRGLPVAAECEGCWAVYGRAMAKREIRSVGHARGGGQSSKAKGRAGVVTTAEMLRTALDLEPGDVWIKATSQLGADIHLSPKAIALFPYAVECKCVESLNIWKALAQAETNATGDLTPIVFFKRARTTMYVALRARDFLQRIKGRS